MTPFDSKALAGFIFMPTQKVLWLSHWWALCDNAAIQNLGWQPGDPLLGVGIPQLMGEAPIATPQLQARLIPEILRQSADLAYEVMLKVPDTGKAVKSFTSIKQGATEPYMQFVDWLQDAIQNQIENTEAQETLLLKLAIENANEDYKRLLRTLCNPTTIDMIDT